MSSLNTKIIYPNNLDPKTNFSSKESTLCLIGHTEYSLKLRSEAFPLPFGEINNAQKLHTVLKKNSIPVSPILDLYELFGIEKIDGEEWQLFRDMIRTNSTLGLSGVGMITDYNNSLTRHCRKALHLALSPYKNPILLLLTWPQEAISLLSAGIHFLYPTIGKEDSYIQGNYQSRLFPIAAFSEEVDLIVGESLLGAINGKEYNLPPEKFLYLPNLAPPRQKKEKKYRKKYLEFLSESHHKPLPKDSLVIGYPTRFVRRKNVEMVIWAIHTLRKKFPNLFLVLKGSFDPECDDMTLYSEKLHQLIQSALKTPWLFWDSQLTSYPEVLNLYSSFDIACCPTGAEIGCNTLVELFSLGIPTVLTNASVIPYLYKGMGCLVKGDQYTVAPWIFPQPRLKELISCLRSLILSPQLREETGKRGQQLAYERFGEEALINRIPLLMEAAIAYHQKGEKEIQNIGKKIRKQLETDFATYQINAMNEL